MFADQNRDRLRRFYIDVWRKFKTGAPLQPLEKQIAAVIGEHPEYVPSIEAEDALTMDLSPDSGRMNHFLHLGLHLALRDQLATDRPVGVAQIHRDLSARLNNAHDAEHRMLEQLAETMWEMQRYGQPFDEQSYLERLRKLSAPAHNLKAT